MIKVDSVTKVYETTRKSGWLRKEKQQVAAVDNLNLEFNRGEIIGLLGLNGAGKTTTIKMLSTLLEPTSGSITIDGLDIVKERRTIQGRINMISGGERMLYWRLTGRENLLYFGRMYGLDEKLIRVRSENLLEEIGLTEAADIPVERYSKGMKQRLQIARGMINDPEYLFLDEPTLGLDAPIARQLRIMVKRLAAEKGKGILLTSHYLQEVEELCDRVYVIDRGKLILCDTPSAVVRNAAGFETVHLHLDGWKEEKIRQMQSFLELPDGSIQLQFNTEHTTAIVSIKTESADELVPKILPWIVGQGMHLKHLATEKPTLEDAIILLAEGGLQHEKVLAKLSS